VISPDERTDLTDHAGAIAWDWYEIPVCLRKVLTRSARLQRFVALDTPTIIVENERRMVAESMMDLAEYVNVHVLDPARVHCQTKEDL
jgi:hypothetical protein